MYQISMITNQKSFWRLFYKTWWLYWSFYCSFSLMYGYQAKSFLLCSIMLDAFKDPLCSKLCWHNRPGPNWNITICSYGRSIYYYNNYVIAYKMNIISILLYMSGLWAKIKWIDFISIYNCSMLIILISLSLQSLIVLHLHNLYVQLLLSS